jgi:predicted RNA-binding Zn ribbon-like protein
MLSKKLRESAEMILSGHKPGQKHVKTELSAWLRENEPVLAEYRRKIPQANDIIDSLANDIRLARSAVGFLEDDFFQHTKACKQCAKAIGTDLIPQFCKVGNYMFYLSHDGIRVLK